MLNLQTFYPLGAIFETVHLEAPKPSELTGPLTSVKVTKETTVGSVRRIQVRLAIQQRTNVIRCMRKHKEVWRHHVATCTVAQFAIPVGQRHITRLANNLQ